jgi:uncharacterized protein (TIGR02246 family)
MKSIIKKMTGFRLTLSKIFVFFQKKMRQFLLVTLCCTISYYSLCQKTLTYNAKDLLMLNALPIKWQKYWNTHNMDSMGTLLMNDVDFINAGGHWLKGKKQAVNDHKEKHQSIKFKTSVWQTDSVQIKYIKPDLALMHIGWGVSGDFENDGRPRPPHHGFFTWVVTKQKDKWFLLAVQNTNTAPVK